MINIKQFKAPISVVIPCYQAEKIIVRAVESVINQSLQVSEIILVDDGSTDNTLVVMNDLVSRYKKIISVISCGSNLGVSSARNKGWERASYDYVAFLDADDVWHPNKIEILYGFLKSHPDSILVGHKHQIKEYESQPWLNLPINYNFKKIQKLRLLLITPFATPTVIVKRNIAFRFDQDMRFAEDYLLWLQIVSSGLSSYKLDLSLAATFKPNYGVAGLSYNLGKMKNGLDKAYLKLYQQGFISIPTLSICLFISYIKHYKRFLVVKLCQNFRKSY
jgi:glycosyltransferase involved in cell wall biosynthesis